MTAVDANFTSIGTGTAVFEDTDVVEGPTVWLDSPDAVLDFVERDDMAECIVIARGGTTTFLTPALVAGPLGVLALQGAPSSHLGIVSREYGIPCIMSVAFTHGEVNARGEVVPPDGTRVRLDLSAARHGVVLADETAGLQSHRPDGDGDGEETGGAAPGEPVDANGVPGGTRGHESMVGKLSTGVLELTDESLARDLTDAELAAVRVEARTLLDRWHAVPPGGTLMLDFTRLVPTA